MRTRHVAMSLVMALVVLPEPVTSIMAVMFICIWCLLQRKRRRALNFFDDSPEVTET